VEYFFAHYKNFKKSLGIGRAISKYVKWDMTKELIREIFPKIDLLASTRGPAKNGLFC
jgi:hypothetical protein